MNNTHIQKFLLLINNNYIISIIKYNLNFKFIENITFIHLILIISIVSKIIYILK